MSFTVTAPAKINLHLRVFPAGRDGFHPLRSWFRTIDLHDELVVEPLAAPPGGSCAGGRLELACDEPTVPADESNLICRAWLADAQAAGGEAFGARLVLRKRIPIGGGLGGGSSNAAAALLGAFRARQSLHRPLIRSDALRQAAESLGSDVPFFVAALFGEITDATCTGRGEIVKPFAPGRRHAVLLMLPSLHVSTPAVYRQFDQMPAPPEDDEPDFAAWSHLSALELLPRLRNDLEPPAFALHPELAALRASAEDHLARPVRMSGSGSSLFTLYDSVDEATAASQALADRLSLRVVVA